MIGTIYGNDPSELVIQKHTPTGGVVDTITTGTPAVLTITANPSGSIVNIDSTAGVGTINNITTTSNNISILNPAGPTTNIDFEPPATFSGDILAWNSATSKYEVQSSDIHIGANAGSGTNNVNIGEEAGTGTTASSRCVSLGYFTATGAVGNNTIAIGYSTGANGGDHIIGLGEEALRTGAGYEAQGYGLLAGAVNAGQNSISLGTSSGEFSCAGESISIGAQTGMGGAGLRSTQIGSHACIAGSGLHSVSLGYYACANHTPINYAPAGSFNIGLSSIRNLVPASSGVLSMDKVTGEIVYSNTIDIVALEARIAAIEAYLVLALPPGP